MIAPVLIGLAFGVILQRAELTRYDRIANVYRLRDLTVLKFLGSALATAAFGIQLARTLGIGEAPPIPLTYAAGNLVGGLVFGVGMALSGFCPGTVAAGAGEGRLDNLIPGALGLYTGAVLYGLLYERMVPVFAKAAEAITFGQLVGVEPWLVVAIVVEVALLGFYLLERGFRGGAAARGR
jgi:uncharacterized membrane protein YedE/YeeE